MTSPRCGGRSSVRCGSTHYEVALAADGQEALDVIAADPHDAVVLDIMMPGVDGLEVRGGCAKPATAPRS